MEKTPQVHTCEDVGLSEEIIHNCIQKQQRYKSMLTTNIASIEIKATSASKDRKLVDSGANRNLTRYRQIFKTTEEFEKYLCMALAQMVQHAL